VRGKITTTIGLITLMVCVAFVFQGYSHDPEAFADSKAWILVGLLSLLATTSASLLCYVSSAIMSRLWALRLLVVVSVSWVLFWLILLEPYNKNYRTEQYDKLGEFVGFAFVPVLAIWGVVWVAKAIVSERE
jgi:hypothetical protein